ncbi:sporulation histidine kinase inhibitor Sda [Virgibacillus oceani]|uniref:Sporulation protein n=1 Tax=Virgibacillus oceani TaxID=1479511 RepID=A0A917HAA4_9BACI|nr:sporulation histidine kinase inhibitor Sda [Virgibacillus oceani]GGG73191.1 hypothetical protein GCM10011398_16990 [Virgibacillus oceani]
MQCLSDHTLIDAYEKAMELNLDRNFIILLVNEVSRRGIYLKITE